MRCVDCGENLVQGARFCGTCGAATITPNGPMVGANQHPEDTRAKASEPQVTVPHTALGPIYWPGILVFIGCGAAIGLGMVLPVVVRVLLFGVITIAAASASFRVGAVRTKAILRVVSAAAAATAALPTLALALLAGLPFVMAHSGAAQRLFARNGLDFPMLSMWQAYALAGANVVGALFPVVLSLGAGEPSAQTQQPEEAPTSKPAIPAPTAAVANAGDTVKPSGPSVKRKCLGGGEIVMTCPELVGQERCALLDPEVFCYDNYLPLIADDEKRVKDWVNDHHWEDYRGKLAYFELNATVEERNGRSCLTAHDGAEIHLCPIDQTKLRAGPVTGFARLVDYKEGPMFGDLDAEILVLMERDAESRRAQRKFIALLDGVRGEGGEIQPSQHMLQRMSDAWNQMNTAHQVETMVLRGIDLPTIVKGVRDKLTREDAGRTLFERYAARAYSPEEFEAMAGDSLWSVYGGSEKDCQGKKLSEPDVKDEWARRDLIAQRDRVAGELLGQAIVFSGVGTLGSDFSISVPSRSSAAEGDRGSDMEVILSDYDVARGRYVLTVKGGGPWPVGDNELKFGRDNMHSDRDVKIGALGGKDVEVTQRQAEHTSFNGSTLQIPIELSEAAATIFRGQQATVTVLLRFSGAGYHKVCTRSCMNMGSLGTSCEIENTGFGGYYFADTLGYQVKVGHEVMAEKVPSAKDISKLNDASWLKQVRDAK